MQVFKVLKLGNTRVMKERVNLVWGFICWIYPILYLLLVVSKNYEPAWLELFRDIDKLFYFGEVQLYLSSGQLPFYSLIIFGAIPTVRFIIFGKHFY